jgi:hypothetical protein
VRGGRKSCEQAYSENLFGDGKTSHMNGIPTLEHCLSDLKNVIFLSVLKILCVGNERQHRPLAILIRTKPFQATRQVAARRDRPLRDSSSSCPVLLRIPRRDDPARTFIAHERTPTDCGATIWRSPRTNLGRVPHKTNDDSDKSLTASTAVQSTTAGDTKLGGWSGRARE